MSVAIDARWRRWPAGRLVIVASLFAVRPVHSDTPAAQATTDELSATADRLFKEGRELAKNNHPAEACKRFEQSYALKHTFGTAVNLGDCARRDGHPGRAWQLYRDAVRAAQQDGVENLAQFARDRAVAMAPELCTVAVAISAADVTGLTVRMNDYEIAPSSQRARWVGLVEPGNVDVEIARMAGGARVTRHVSCAAGEVSDVSLRGDDLGVGSGVQVVRADLPAPRAADLSVGVGYLPEQYVHGGVAFGASVDGWTWSRLAIIGHLVGAAFHTQPFMDPPQQRTVRQTGTFAFFGPSLRYAPASRVWLEAGAGVAAGFWVGGDHTSGAVRPGLELGAGYWFARSFNLSIDSFGFTESGARLGSVFVMIGAKLH